MIIASVLFLQLMVLTWKNRLYYFFHPNFTFIRSAVNLSKAYQT